MTNKLYYIANTNRLTKTNILIACFIIIFIISNLIAILSNTQYVNVLVNFWALRTDLVISWEVWRIFTSMFLHADIMHILFNSIALFQIWNIIEEKYHWSKMLVVFIISWLIWGIFSIITDLFSNSIFIPSVGASWWVFWLLWFLVADLNYKNRINISKEYLYLTILFNLFMWLIIPFINNSAHIWWFLWGLLLTAILLRIIKQEESFEL